MNFEIQYNNQQNKKFKHYSFASRYDNATTSYFKYYKFEDLIPFIGLDSNEKLRLEKQFVQYKKNKQNKKFAKIKKLNIQSKYLYDYYSDCE